MKEVLYATEKAPKLEMGTRDISRPTAVRALVPRAVEGGIWLLIRDVKLIRCRAVTMSIDCYP